MDNMKLGSGNIKLTNDKEYYTIPEIVEQAKIIFGFKFPTDNNDRIKVDKKIKQAIRRALDGEQPIQPEGSKRKSMYSRAAVYSVLNSKCRHYFLTIKKELSETGKKTEAKAKSEKAKRQIKAVKHTKQIDIDEYHKAMIANNEQQAQDDDGGEKPILLKLEETKVKIFFQYLFESLIDFDESGYVNDLQDAPDPFDIRPSELEVASVQRLLDLHNYYTGRVDLAEVLNRLCQASSTDTKPQEKQ